MIVVRFFAIIAVAPAFAAPAIGLAGAGGFLGNVYMKAQLPVKRESSNAKAPVLGHFGAAIAGLGKSLDAINVEMTIPDNALNGKSRFVPMDRKKHSDKSRSRELTSTLEQ